MTRHASDSVAVAAPDAVARWRVRARRGLIAALGLSLLIHAVATFLPEPASAPDNEGPPLTATLTELPPPPKPVASAPTARAQPSANASRTLTVKRRAARTTTSEAPAPVEPSIASAPSSASGAARQNAAQAAAPSPAPLAEDMPIPGAGEAIVKTLPPRVDLAYKVFLGTRGFQIGEATYRFEHANNRYRISTVGHAFGFAALLMRGQGKLESRGLITSSGLQPIEFSVDRFNRRGRESARFDWESGIVTLRDNEIAALDIPTFDPLTLMWQYYFSPPTDDVLTLSIATTRRVARYTVTREGPETIRWGQGTIETERWARRDPQGRTEAYAWLAPSLRFIPVKMRITDTARGTAEAVLDAIRVDETGQTVGRDDMPLLPSPPEPTPAANVPGADERPGTTFRDMTGQ